MGGVDVSELYFEQLTPLVILSDTADDTDQSIEEVQEEVDDSLMGGDSENKEETLTKPTVKEYEPMRPSDFGFESYYDTDEN